MRILLISPMLPGIGGVSVSSHRLLLNLKMMALMRKLLI